MRHLCDTRPAFTRMAEPTCTNLPDSQVQAPGGAVARQGTHSFAPLRSDLDTNQTQAARSTQTQASDLQLVELAGGRTLANLGHLPCLSARLPDLGSPWFASVCHLPVRETFGESGVGR